MKHKFGRVLATMACASAVVTLAACGSDGDDTTTNESASTTTASTPSVSTSAQKIEQIDSAAAGKAEAGEQVELPKNKTIGYLDVVGGLDSTVRDRKAAEEAAKTLGWKIVYCDGQGDPSKSATCMNTLLGRNVDAIISSGTAASVVASGLRTARERKIPAIVFSGENPGWDAQYGPDEARKGEVLAEYFKQKLGEVEGDKVEIAVSAYPLPWAQNRTKELTKVVEGDSKLEVVATTAPDPANLIEGSRKATQDQLTQNPNIKAFWVDFDAVGQTVGQVVSSKYPGKTFPDRPLVATFHADEGSNKLIRSGAIDVVSDAAYDTGAWVTFDQLAKLWARDEPLSEELSPSYGDEAGDLYTYQIIDKSNVPAEGELATGRVDVPEFFKAKWAAEYGTGS